MTTLRHFCSLALALSLPGAASLSGSATSFPRGRQAIEAISASPLRFESQADPEFPFIARNATSSVLLGPQRAIVQVRGTQPIRIELERANPASVAEPLDPLAVRSNYFVGRDPARWRRDVPNYSRVLYHSVWPGIDLVYYGNGDRLEFDFVVAPGADPRAIGFRVESAEGVRLDANGDLILGEGVRQHKPRVYQETPDGRKSIAGRYTITAGNRVHFQLGKYDRSLPLVIDPVLAYSTLFGGILDDGVNGLAVDSAGNAYITGWTESPDLPTTTGGTKYMGSTPPDIYVAKIKPDGTGLVYCSYFGGAGDDEPDAIAIDSSGNVYVTGFTFSSDFPIVSGLQTTYGGGKGDAFVFKLNAAGNALLYSTYLGGTSEDEGRAIAVDSTGFAYVTGITSSSAFPTAGSPYQAKSKGGPYEGFVAKLNQSGSALVYSTLLGSSGDDEPTAIAIDASGSAYIAGSTDAADFPTTKGAFAQTAPNPYEMAFVTKLNPTGTALVYSTYLGGNIVDVAMGIAVDSSGSAYVVGTTGSTNFPRTPAVFQSTFGGGLLDGFVSKLKPDGSGLVYSTYLGGSDDDLPRAVVVDTAGNAYVTGSSSSSDFPTGGSPFQATLGGSSDAFVTKLNPTGTALAYSSYIGGSQAERGVAIALVSPGFVYVAGATASTNFRTTAGAMRKTPSLADAFIVKVQEVSMPSMAVDKSSLSFSFDIGGAAPGPQTIQLTSTGAAVSFTAATSGATWLAVGPGSGVTPATLSAFVNTAGLAPGAYPGNIVLTSTGSANSPLTIPVKLTVTQGQPAPTLSGILPTTVPAGGPDVYLTVNGTNFVNGSVVQVNGTGTTTTFVNPTTLSAVIPAVTCGKAGTVSITVANPAPNAAVTTPLTLTVTAPLPSATSAGVVNAASLASGAVAPGEVLKITGSNFGPATAVLGDASSGAYDTTLAGVRVWFDSTPAPLLSVSATEIVAVVPFELDGQQATQFQVESNGQKSAAVPLAVVPAAPAIYTIDGSGQGQGQATDEDGSPNSKDNPAANGSLVTFSATGGGQTNPASVTGAVVSDNTPQLNQTVGVQIGGVDCEAVTVNPAPGLISGMLLVTARVPADVAGTTPVVFLAGGAASQTGVTIEVTPAAQ